MFVPRLFAGGILNQIVSTQANLRPDKFNDFRRDQFARSQHPAGIAKDAQLQSEAEPVVSAPTLLDMAEVFIAQRVVPQQIRLGGWQTQQRVLLSIGERDAARHSCFFFKN